MEVESQPFPESKNSMVTKLIVAVIATAVITGGTLYAMQQKETTELQTQIDTLTSQVATKLESTPTTAVAEATNPSVTTPTPELAYKQFASDFNFNFEHTKDWTFSQFGSGEGLRHTTYTALTANTEEEGILDETFTTVSAIVYPEEIGDLNVIINDLKTSNEHAVNNLTDVTIGTGKYAAKRYDDGGGFYGTTVSYLSVFTTKDGGNVFVTLSTATDEPAKNSVDFQHMLDTLTFNK